MRVADASQGSERCADRGRRSPRRNLRPTTTRGRRTPSLLLVPPTVFPPLGVRSPPSDSPVGLPERPSPCGCCTDGWVLCTRSVAARATLGCSRVARFPPSPDGRPEAVVPAGRRPRGTASRPSVGGRSPGRLTRGSSGAASAPEALRRETTEGGTGIAPRSPAPPVTRAPTWLDHSTMPSCCPGDSGPTH
jgi:hypothetical protein